MKRFSLVGMIVVACGLATGCNSGSQGPVQEAKKDTPPASAPAPTAPVAAPPPSSPPAPAAAPATARKPPKETPEEARKQLEALGLPYEAKALVDSATKGDVAAVEHLLAAGMDPNTKDAATWTPL